VCCYFYTFHSPFPTHSTTMYMSSQIICLPAFISNISSIHWCAFLFFSKDSPKLYVVFVPSFFLTFCYVNCSNFNATFAAFVIFWVFVSFFCGFWKYLQTDLLYFFWFPDFHAIMMAICFPCSSSCISLLSIKFCICLCYFLFLCTIFHMYKVWDPYGYCHWIY